MSAESHPPTDVEFRLLGPIELVARGEPVELGHLRQRCVLAVLGAQANRVVPLGQLVDQVWGESAPDSANNLLYGYLGRLRRCLAGVDGPVELSRRSGGYRLGVDEDAVDLFRFRRLVTRGRAAGDPATAVGLLEEALCLWRGAAFAGATGWWLTGLRQSLADERFAAVVKRNDVALGLGEHGRLLAELRTLATEHPRDERVTAQLMLALHRSGRSVEALSVYSDIRRRLGSEFGLDPGGPLRALEQQILLNDRALDLPDAPMTPDPPQAAPALAQLPSQQQAGPGVARQQAEPGVARQPAWPGVARRQAGPGLARQPAGPGVARQLPAAPERFTGREDELAALDVMLRDRVRGTAAPALVSITGMPGVGKTALALHWAHRVRQLFPDGDLYVDFGGSVGPAWAGTVPAALHHFARALGSPAAVGGPGALHRSADRQPTAPGWPDAQPLRRLDEAAARYRTQLAGRRVLVVLDDVADADQVRPFLPGTPGCLVLVTSRNRLGGLTVRDGARHLPLAVPSEDEAVALVGRFLGQRTAQAEPEAVIQLVRSCDRLPLALCIAAAPIAAVPTAAAPSGDPRRRLGERVAVLAGEDRLARLAVPGDTRTSVRSAFQRSYAALPADLRRTFRSLGWHADQPVTVPVVARLSGLDPERAGRHLAALADAHLLEALPEHGYAMHGLLRLFAAEQDGAPERPPARHRRRSRQLTPAPSAEKSTSSLTRRRVHAGPRR